MLQTKPSCSQTVEIGWILLALAVPIYFNPLANEPFEPAKAALVRWVTLLMVSAWTVQQAGSVRGRSGQLARGFWHHLRMMRRNNPLSLPAIALATAYVLASATSIDPSSSIWLSRHQALGTLTMLCYASAFLIIADRLKSPAQPRRFVAAILLASAPVAAYGIFQGIGLDIWAWQTDSVSKSLSTLGRSNFLGAYLAMVIPLTVATLFLSRRRAVQAGWGMLLVMQTVCLAQTGARAAWLALVVAASLLLWLVFQGGVAKEYRSLVTLSAILVPVIVIVLSATFSGALTRYKPLAVRLNLWRYTCSMISDRWLTGYGPGMFSRAFAQYRPERWRQPGRELVFESAHNGVLDLAAGTGIVGLVSYGWFVFRLYALGFRAVSDSNDVRQQVLISACLASLLAFHVQDLFTPCVVTTQLLFWLLAALLVCLSRVSPPGDCRPGQQSTPRLG